MGLFECGERQEEFIVVALVEVFDEVPQNGEVREDLVYFGCADDLYEHSFVNTHQGVSSSGVFSPSS